MKSKRRNRLNRTNNLKKVISCCKINNQNEKKHKQCIRLRDRKLFKLPRRFNRTECRNPKGFTMRSSCAIYKDC